MLTLVAVKGLAIIPLKPCRVYPRPLGRNWSTSRAPHTATAKRALIENDFRLLEKRKRAQYGAYVILRGAAVEIVCGGQFFLQYVI